MIYVREKFVKGTNSIDCVTKTIFYDFNQLNEFDSINTLKVNETQRRKSFSMKQMK